MVEKQARGRSGPIHLTRLRLSRGRGRKVGPGCRLNRVNASHFFRFGKGIRMHRKQLTVFFILLAVYSLCAFISYSFFMDQLIAFTGTPIPDMGVPPVVFGLAIAGIVLVVYGLLGLGGYWLARKLGLPGILQRRWELEALVLYSDGDWYCLRCNSCGRRQPLCPHQWFWQVSSASVSGFFRDCS